jgi:hypothetical protein
MSDKRQLIPITGLVATAAIAIYMVVQLTAQTVAPVADLTNAVTAEVHDAQGQVVLRGQFAAADEDDDDVERKAALTATGIDADAEGEAEVEFARTAATHQEVEFAVRNLAPGTSVTFIIDGHSLGQATVDRRGRAELELDIRMP